MSFAVHAAEQTGGTVTDLDRATDFWVDTLGFTLARRGHLGGEFAAGMTGSPVRTLRSPSWSRRAAIESSCCDITSRRTGAACGPGRATWVRRVPGLPTCATNRTVRCSNLLSPQPAWKQADFES
ncbi:hypothetical protein G3I59_33230 [Amycolatopsis rubida]|uniref:Glyoxalase/fosfomycin resistance/dioxygenase domain-containing protein n=1 Tax=Amycolatopsis rubida TaxID=112413 RepID=A0ABX0BXH9_9PSEU|nr:MULTISPECIES: VOC family protein [Amycolatopsis]MYW95333.1 hypothetical protein [Amycolatopsis rubida]NEC60322.1 hypothetical protein [Amycolatopsis rubida]